MQGLERHPLGGRGEAAPRPDPADRPDGRQRRPAAARPPATPYALPNGRRSAPADGNGRGNTRHPSVIGSAAPAGPPRRRSPRTASRRRRRARSSARRRPRARPGPRSGPAGRPTACPSTGVLGQLRHHRAAARQDRLGGLGRVRARSLSSPSRSSVPPQTTSVPRGIDVDHAVRVLLVQRPPGQPGVGDPDHLAAHAGQLWRRRPARGPRGRSRSPRGRPATAGQVGQRRGDPERTPAAASSSSSQRR